MVDGCYKIYITDRDTNYNDKYIFINSDTPFLEVLDTMREAADLCRFELITVKKFGRAEQLVNDTDYVMYLNSGYD